MREPAGQGTAILLTTQYLDEARPLAHPATATLALTALLLAVFVPLATARYARPA